jgi:hypothetical protein
MELFAVTGTEPSYRCAVYGSVFAFGIVVIEYIVGRKLVVESITVNTFYNMYPVCVSVM